MLLKVKLNQCRDRDGDRDRDRAAPSSAASQTGTAPVASRPPRCPSAGCRVACAENKEFGLRIINKEFGLNLLVEHWGGGRTDWPGILACS